MMDDDLTLAETAAHLRRNRELVRQWLKSGRLAGFKREGRWLVTAKDLAIFLKAQPVRRTRRSSHAS